ncbi:diguanylate cyclase [Vibrio sp. S11_S32]|uniref:sensor domain-containing diguanylate cyclase n=1 Tax=Vibrio sp. S11_S32 TaxID=2720225 RepID=UPI00168075B0|nr:sensor domain-containing diguanylate cyclase [Vibrio sp. S11_S32]MBD1575495.1 diguanylate cyclase [Vibrio sp. S11_S32]
MYHQSKITYKTAILAPLALALVMVAILALNYAKSLDEEVNIEYGRMTSKLEHSIKVLGATNYIFSTYFTNGSPKSTRNIPYNRQTDSEGFCTWFPSQEKMQSAYRTDNKNVLKVNYAVKGLEGSCDPNSPVYQDIESKLTVASSFSFLSELKQYIAGLYYISPKGYMVASPAENVRLLHKNAVPILTHRNYWQNTQDGTNNITLTGPHNDVISGKPILTVSTGLYDNDQFEGVVILDILISKLSLASEPLSKNIRFSPDDERALPSDARMPRPVWIEGVKTNQVMYFQWSWLEEVQDFFNNNIQRLVGILLLYIFTTSIFIYLKLNYERHYFRELSLRDPMTSLLNRRGLELAYKGVIQQEFEGVAIFDIDDFKTINDTYGHDIGDEVICYVGQVLHRNTRASDVVLRFGGEEFVVYMQGSNETKIIDALTRVQKEITKGSHRVMKSGFSVSGGVIIRPTGEKHTFDSLLKEADDKLYVAKQSGKNRVII